MLVVTVNINRKNIIIVIENSLKLVEDINSRIKMTFRLIKKYVQYIQKSR